MRSLIKDTRGNMAVLFGLSLPMLAIATAAAVDYSDAGRRKTELQATADASALAGARELANGGGQTSTEAVSAAEALPRNSQQQSRRTRSRASPSPMER
jgi:Flp pilus assembly protein TadG